MIHTIEEEIVTPNADSAREIIRCQAECSCGGTSGKYQGPRGDLANWLARLGWLDTKTGAKCSMTCALNKSGAVYGARMASRGATE